MNTYSEEFNPQEEPLPTPQNPLYNLSDWKYRLIGTSFIPTRSETVQESDARGYALGKQITTHYVRLVWTWELVPSDEKRISR